MQAEDIRLSGFLSKSMENLHEMQSTDRRSAREDGGFVMWLRFWKIWPLLASPNATLCGDPFARSVEMSRRERASMKPDHPAAARACAAAASRRQSRHRQSPPAVGIGNFAGSSIHQQLPERSQPNSVPQAEQVRRRLSGTSPGKLSVPVGFVMQTASISVRSSCGIHLLEPHMQTR